MGTTTAMVQIMDTIMDAVDNNEIAATMNIDQSAAFNCVQHNLLIDKLRHYHLDEDCIKWFESYLSFRSAYVSIGSAVSNMIPLKYSVPQGSVLGPLCYH